MPSSYDIIHSKKHEILIGEFNTDELITELNVVTNKVLPGLGAIRITVYDSEQYGCPHFHILKRDGEKYSCICIFKARYFVHGDYKNTLNSRQKKQLDYILRLPCKRQPEISNWKFISNFWLIHIDTKGIYSSYANSKQPDYTKLDGFIRE